MANIPQHVLDVGEQIHFTATHYKVDGEFEHYDALAAALRERPKLSDYEDDDGNMQSLFRIDVVNGEVWVTVPETVKRPEIDEAVKNYDTKVAELYPPEEEE